MKQMNFKFKNMEFGVKIKDRYEQEEVNAILYYLKHAEFMDDYQIIITSILLCPTIN